MEDDLFGDLEVFEHYGVNHTVSELKKIKVKVQLTLPSTFEEYGETLQVPEMGETTEASTTTEPNGDVPLQNQAESGDGDEKKEGSTARSKGTRDEVRMGRCREEAQAPEENGPDCDFRWNSSCIL